MENYYKTLGIKRTSSLKEISAAYRAQALLHHPDKRQKTPHHHEDDESVDQFIKIKTAYQALQDPKIRAELDLQLIGLEERNKRDLQMSAQRKQMKDELLNREMEAKAKNQQKLHMNKNKNKDMNMNKNNKDVEEKASLLLKCKLPSYNSNSQEIMSIEMIKNILGPKLKSLNEQTQSSQTIKTFIAEFTDPQEAYKVLCKLPNDLIIKADWLTGYPPDDIVINFEKGAQEKEKFGDATDGDKVSPVNNYSKDFENSVLERLKQKKRNQQSELK